MPWSPRCALRQTQRTFRKAQGTYNKCALSLSKGIELGTLAGDLSTLPQGLLPTSQTNQHDHEMPWVYILRCADDSFYIGSTRDLESRLQQHAIGGGDAYTRTRRPLALAWAQECEHIEDAYLREHKIKGWRREKKLALISGRYRDLPRLSRSGSHKHPASGTP
jgi:putative endonuclease